MRFHKYCLGSFKPTDSETEVELKLKRLSNGWWWGLEVYCFLQAVERRRERASCESAETTVRVSFSLLAPLSQSVSSTTVRAQCSSLLALHLSQATLSPPGWFLVTSSAPSKTSGADSDNTDGWSWLPAGADGWMGAVGELVCVGQMAHYRTNKQHL